MALSRIRSQGLELELTFTLLVRIERIPIVREA
jgi:hypothetical protein